MFVIPLGFVLGSKRRRFQSEAGKEPLGEISIGKQKRS